MANDTEWKVRPARTDEGPPWEVVETRIVGKEQYPAAVFQGSLADCESYIRLKKEGLL